VGDERLWTAILQGLTARGIAEHVDVVADYELPLAAAAPDGIGISLISGTGSVAFGRNRKGATARAGGWGYLFGDLGSAYANAREALQEAARADDGCRMRTSLSRALAQFFGVATIRDVADLVYRSEDPRRLIASAARVVFAERERGDLLAQNLIERARGGLGDLLFALADRLTLDGEPFTLALAGGVLTGNNAFAEELIGSAAMNLEAAPRAVLVCDPAVGGVHLALRRYEAAHRGPHGPGR
jgi:N-acetylglucosamine kinase-like BadF-type ATPase